MGSLERHVQNAAKMMRTHRFGTAFRQIDCLQPLVRRHMASTHQRAMQDREYLATFVALACAKTCRGPVQFADLIATALWAIHAVRPKHALKITIRTEFVRKHG